MTTFSKNLLESDMTRENVKAILVLSGCKTFLIGHVTNWNKKNIIPFMLKLHLPRLAETEIRIQIPSHENLVRGCTCFCSYSAIFTSRQPCSQQIYIWINIDHRRGVFTAGTGPVVQSNVMYSDQFKMICKCPLCPHAERTYTDSSKNLFLRKLSHSQRSDDGIMSIITGKTYD